MTPRNAAAGLPATTRECPFATTSLASGPAWSDAQTAQAASVPTAGRQPPTLGSAAVSLGACSTAGARVWIHAGAIDSLCRIEVNDAGGPVRHADHNGTSSRPRSSELTIAAAAADRRPARRC